MPQQAIGTDKGRVGRGSRCREIQKSRERERPDRQRVLQMREWQRGKERKTNRELRIQNKIKHEKSERGTESSENIST